MKGPSTLLIDDEERFSSSMVALLRDTGVGVESAESWERGLALFRRSGHELVIADYNLPGSRHGLQLLAAIKPLRPSTRLVLISGALNQEALSRVGETALVDEYFLKDGALADHLVRQGIEAEARASEQTGWRAVGRAYASGSEIDFEAVNGIDAALRVEIGDPQ